MAFTCFSSNNSSTLWFRKPIAMPAAEEVYSNFAFQNSENNHRVSVRIHWSHCENNLSRNSVDYPVSINSYSEWWTNNSDVGLQWLVLIQCWCPVISPKLEHLPFPFIYKYTYVYVCLSIYKCTLIHTQTYTVFKIWLWPQTRVKLLSLHHLRFTGQAIRGKKWI